MFNCKTGNKKQGRGQILFNIPSAKEFRFKNGAGGKAVQIKGRDAAVSFTFPFGLAEDLHGSHLLEHLLFRSRCGLGNGYVVDRKIEDLGGYYNGATREDRMILTLRCAAVNLVQALELVCRSVMEIDIDRAIVEGEKTIVIGEYLERVSGIDYFVELAHERHLLENTPLFSGRETIYGTRRLTAGDLRRIKKKNIGSNGLCMGVAAPDIDQIVKALERTFGTLPEVGNERPYLRMEEVKAKESILRQAGQRDSSVSIAFQTEGYRNPDRMAVKLLTLYLTGRDYEYSSSSRFWRRLREEGRVIYDVEQEEEDYGGLGTVRLQCSGILRKNIGLVKKGMLEEIAALTERKIRTNKFDGTKRALVRALGRSYADDKIDELAETLAEFEFYGKRYDYRQIVGAVEAVTREDARDAAQKYMNPERFSTVIVRGR